MHILPGIQIVSCKCITLTKSPATLTPDTPETTLLLARGAEIYLVRDRKCTLGLKWT